MKKALKSLFILFLIFNIAIPVHASSIEVDVPNDTDFKINAPEDWYTVTRDIKKGDSILDILNTTPEKLLESYKKGNIYANFIKKDLSQEIIIVLYENEKESQLGDFKNEADDILKKYMKNYIEDDKARDVSKIYTYSSIYENDISKFMVFDYQYMPYNCTVYSKRFFTVINNMKFNIILNSYNVTEIDEQTDSMLNQMVDNIEFTKLGITVEKVIFAGIIGIIILLLLLGGISLIRASIKYKREKKEQEAAIDEAATDFTDIGI